VTPSSNYNRTIHTAERSVGARKMAAQVDNTITTETVATGEKILVAETSATESIEVVKKTTPTAVASEEKQSEVKSSATDSFVVVEKKVESSDTDSFVVVEKKVESSDTESFEEVQVVKATIPANVSEEDPPVTVSNEIDNFVVVGEGTTIPAAASVNNFSVVITAGRSRRGKSNVLNTLYGTNFKCQNAAKAVTEEITFADTPGLGDKTIPSSAVKRDYTANVGALNFTLLYCLSVGPGHTLDKIDDQVFRHLQQVFGKKVWKKCVILLTFSDSLREIYPGVNDRNNYLDALRDHVDELKKALTQCCKDIPDIKLITDVGDENRENVIVAVPVGRTLIEGKEEKVLIPKEEIPIEEGGEINWKEKARSEIKKKLRPVGNIKLDGHEKEIAAGVVVSVAAGGALGLVAGTVTGAFAGGFGAIPGAIIGAIAGSLAGATSSGRTGTLMLIPNTATENKNKENIKKWLKPSTKDEIESSTSTTSTDRRERPISVDSDSGSH